VFSARFVLFSMKPFPKGWLRSTFITLPKLNNVTSCKDHQFNEPLSEAFPSSTTHKALPNM